MFKTNKTKSNSSLVTSWTYPCSSWLLATTFNKVKGVSMSGPGLLQNSDKHPVTCDISKRRYIHSLLYTQRYTEIGNV